MKSGDGKPSLDIAAALFLPSEGWGGWFFLTRDSLPAKLFIFLRTLCAHDFYGGKNGGRNSRACFLYSHLLEFSMQELRMIRVRVPQELYTQVKARAQLCGFKTLSAYVRDKLMRFPHNMEQMLEEICEKLIKTRPRQ